MKLFFFLCSFLSSVNSYELLYPCLTCVKALERFIQSYTATESKLLSQSIILKNNYTQFLFWLTTVNPLELCPPITLNNSGKVCIWYEGGVCQQFYSSKDVKEASDWNEQLQNPFDRAFKVSVHGSPSVSQATSSINQQTPQTLPIQRSDERCLEIVSELKNSLQLQGALDNGCTYSQVMYQQIMKNGTLGPLLNEGQKQQLELEIGANWSTRRISQYINRCTPRLTCNCLVSKSSGLSYCQPLPESSAPSACVMFGAEDVEKIEKQRKENERKAKELENLGHRADELAAKLNDPP